MSILAAQEATRVAELVPLRHERMLASPFAFYRGAAAIMAADLAATPNSGIRVQCCGDAHLANFGGFQSPERTTVFDINDFDETARGPWEWDLKRLAASFVIAAHDREFDEAVGRAAVTQAARTYRETMRAFAAQANLDVWYSRLDIAGFMERWGTIASAKEVARLQRNVQKGATKNSSKALQKLTARVDGAIRIVDDPPLVVRLEELLPPDRRDALTEQMRALLHSYSHTLQRDRRELLETFRFVDIARKVVGVGSVGTRCWIMLLLGRDETDPLFLQVKEAQASVLEPFVGKTQYAQHGQRVVEGQRVMQAASDIFLGWQRVNGFDDVHHDYYVRQLWDGKISADLTTITPNMLTIYASMCGWTLARAHARSGDRHAIAAYLGSSDVFDRAMVEFAFAYAEQNARDYATVSTALTTSASH